MTIINNITKKINFLYQKKKIDLFFSRKVNWYGSFNNIKNTYIINKDLSVDILKEDLHLNNLGLTNIPFKINKLKSSIPSLRGREDILLSTSILISGNKIEKLKYPLPRVNYLHCRDNRLMSLEAIDANTVFYANIPIEPIIDQFVNQRDLTNWLISGVSNSRYIKRKDLLIFNDLVKNYNFIRGDYKNPQVVKSRFKEALEEIDKELPKSIKGIKYI